MDPLARLLADLVAIPSVNPMGRTPSGPGILERDLTAYLDRYFQGLGVAIERQPIAPGRDNILARYEAPGARRTILFDAHQDTVPADNMIIPPFTPTIAANRLHGRGACDVKGGMAAMLAAFARLVRERPVGSASVIMACTVDEEFTHKGSSRLAEEPLGVDLAVVAEPTGLDLVTSHKGAVRWKARTRGVACHSSAPERGENAIYRMARVVSALAEHACELAGAEPDSVLGPPSLSVGRIEGGQSVNIVPDACEIEVDRRVIPREEPAGAIAAAAEALRSRLGAREMEKVEFLPPWVNMPALRANVPLEAIDAISAIVTRASGRPPRVGGVPFGTDAGPLGRAGVSCLVLGPGDIAQAHTEDEWIDLDQVRAAAEVYFEIARELG